MSTRNHDSYLDTVHDIYHHEALQMTTAELQEQILQLRRVNSDLTHLEAKQATHELPKRLWETLSAFSNTPGGGAIIFGISEEAGFAIVGIKNPARLQHDLGCLCSEMEPPVRAHIQVHTIGGKQLVTAGVPEITLQQKPCFYPSAGLTNGAFIRVADGDRKLSSYEVQMMLSARGQPREDEEPVANTDLSDLQPRLVRSFINRLRKRRSGRFEKLSDENVLRTVKVLVPSGPSSWVCSLGGLLAMGKYPQEFFPALSLIFIAYPRTEVGAPGSNQERFLDNERIEGAVPDILRPTLDILQRNMKRRSVVSGLYRTDLDEYPATAVREAVINALVHRDLSNGSRGTPVQVQMFPDRLVIYNPGGLYGPVTVDSLGREGISASRNNTLLRILEDVTVGGDRQAVCENRGSGVGAIVAALKQSGLPDPLFDDQIASFRVIFKNAAQRGRKRDRRAEILNLLRDHGAMSRSELSKALGISDIATRKWLQALREERSIDPTEASLQSRNLRYRLIAK